MIAAWLESFIASDTNTHVFILHQASRTRQLHQRKSPAGTRGFFGHSKYGRYTESN